MTNPVRAGFDRLSADLRASLLLIVAFALFSAMSVFMRMIGDRIGVPQVILVRQVLTLVMLVPVFWGGRKTVFRPSGLGLHLTRGLLAVGGMACGLTSILHIPLADATAIGMSDALIMTALAALILREPVGWRRWSATAVGFVGVLVMIRPFGDGFDTYALVALAGAAFGASSVIALRLGSGLDSTATVMFWQGLVVAVLAAPLALIQWVMPMWQEAGVLFIMSVIFAAGNWLLTVGFRLGHAAAMAPLGYLRLLMMAGAGWFIYGEVPSWATVAGGTLVIASATYTLTRNAERSSPVPPPLPPTLP